MNLVNLLSDLTDVFSNLPSSSVTNNFNLMDLNQDDKSIINNNVPSYNLGKIYLLSFILFLYKHMIIIIASN